MIYQLCAVSFPSILVAIFPHPFASRPRPAKTRENMPSTNQHGSRPVQCKRWPLMIDPQLQGIRWLRRHEEVATEAADRSLHVLQMGEVGAAG